MVLRDRSGSDDSMGDFEGDACDQCTREDAQEHRPGNRRPAEGKLSLFQEAGTSDRHEEPGHTPKPATGPEVPTDTRRPRSDSERAAPEPEGPPDERETRSVEQAIDDIEPANPLLKSGPINLEPLPDLASLLGGRVSGWRASSPARPAVESRPTQYLSGDDPGVSRPGLR